MPATTNQNNTQGNTAGNSMEQLQMEAVIMQHNPERGVLASADVKIGGFMTIRNVRIKGEEMAGTTEKKKISMIPAKPQYDRSVKPAEKRLKVAVYCRVSTELELSLIHI